MYVWLHGAFTRTSVSCPYHSVFPNSYVLLAALVLNYMTVCCNVSSGCQDHWAQGGVVLWPHVCGQQRSHHLAKTQQEGREIVWNLYTCKSYVYMADM